MKKLFILWLITVMFMGFADDLKEGEFITNFVKAIIIIDNLGNHQLALQLSEKLEEDCCDWNRILKENKESESINWSTIVF